MACFLVCEHLGGLLGLVAWRIWVKAGGLSFKEGLGCGLLFGEYLCGLGLWCRRHRLSFYIWGSWGMLGLW
ncbi:hypothetical protein BKH40_08380 [Helicobacter sp. 11S02629-2]|nr:hypothetical protein BKH40_08380 [Helicobacter sp. 11S02629-2]